MEEKERFKIEFERTVEAILKKYPTKEGVEKEIVGHIINTFLHQVQIDVEKLTFVDFYKEYLQGTLYLDYNDFTSSQIREIIDESPLSELDKKLSIYYWLEMRSEEDIARELGIDKKTVRKHIPNVSMVLKKTSSRLYK